MCVKWSLVVVLVLDWTQCIPQGGGASKKNTGWPSSYSPVLVVVYISVSKHFLPLSPLGQPHIASPVPGMPIPQAVSMAALLHGMPAAGLQSFPGTSAAMVTQGMPMSSLAGV